MGKLFIPKYECDVNYEMLEGDNHVLSYYNHCLNILNGGDGIEHHLMFDFQPL